MKGNFEFVKKFDNEIYTLISDGEKNLKIHVPFAGKALREAFERFIKYIVMKYPGIDKGIKAETGKKFVSLHERIKFLSSQEMIDKYNINCKALELTPLSVDDVLWCVRDDKRARREFQNPYLAKTIKTDADYVRKIGNDCTHEDMKERTLKRTYTNVLDGYKYFYQILKNYFCKTNGLPAFDADIVPIGNYYIESSCIPSDYASTHCRHEYLAKAIASDNIGKTRYEWAIIREYSKENMDSNFLERGLDAQICADTGISGAPTGMAMVQPITRIDDENAPFYIIAYLFKRRPYPLAEVIDRLTDENKYDICIRIADCFRNLHNSEIPIYHRMLNYNCIYLCDFTDTRYNMWLPAVTKFNFSKVEDACALTVITNLTNAMPWLSPEEAKYTSPEWKSNPLKSNWEKVDVYAMGVLFADIIGGKIMKCLDDFGKLDGFADTVNESILILIDDMTSEDIYDRPNAEEIYRCLVDNR